MVDNGHFPSLIIILGKCKWLIFVRKCVANYLTKSEQRNKKKLWINWAKSEKSIMLPSKTMAFFLFFFFSSFSLFLFLFLLIRKTLSRLVAWHMYVCVDVYSSHSNVATARTHIKNIIYKIFISNITRQNLNMLFNWKKRNKQRENERK